MEMIDKRDGLQGKHVKVEQFTHQDAGIAAVEAALDTFSVNVDRCCCQASEERLMPKEGDFTNTALEQR